MSRSAVGEQGVPMKADREPAERIRRREVSRVLGGTNLSPDEERAIERLSRSLVTKLLCGPCHGHAGRRGGGSYALLPDGPSIPVEDVF
jgi:hypothetical protein